MKKKEVIELVKQGHKITTCRPMMGMTGIYMVGDVPIRKSTAFAVIEELHMTTNDKTSIKTWCLPNQ